MDNCLFCKIVAGQIPSNKVFEDEKCIAFRDINPQAPVHVLIVPKEHMPDITAGAARGDDLVGHLIAVATRIAAQEGLTNGFRLITNCGPDACQSVHHLHIHLLGGTKMAEKMA